MYRSALGGGGSTQWRASNTGALHLTRGQTAIRLFVTCWIVYVLHFATNIVREIYPALTLGDSTSINVHEYKDLHPDIFQPDPNVPRSFINSNPGASILAAIPYGVASPLINRVSERVQQRRAEAAANGTEDVGEYESPWPMARDFHKRVTERGLDVKFGLAAAVMQTTLMAPLSALSAVIMFYILAHRTGSARIGLGLAVLFAFATPIFFRTGQLNQNLIVCHCGLIAFALLWRPWDPPEMPRRPLFLLAGLICGWSVVCDYSGLVLVLIIPLYGLFKWAGLPPQLRRVSDPFVFALGVLISGAVLGWYQWAAFGHPLWPAQHYMPPVLHSDQGYQGFSWPQADLAWATAFDYRYGLFTSAPILILAIWIPSWFRRGGRLIGRLEFICALFVIIGFFTFCSANQYGRMQFNTGVRHIVPVVPFIFLLASGAILRMPRLLTGLIAAISLYWSWCLAMYRDVERGLGVAEAVLRITLGGFELPWLTTVKRMPAFSNYVGPTTSPAPILVAASLAIFLMWWLRPVAKRPRGLNESQSV